MPRPTSELTGMKPRALVARLTERQKIAFLRLGGSKWLRQVLNFFIEDLELEQSDSFEDLLHVELGWNGVVDQMEL